MAIQDVETVTEAFVEWLESQNIGTFGEDLFIRRVRQFEKNDVYWLITSGGVPVQKLRSGETVKQYSILINYRSMDGKLVEKKLFRLEELLNSAGCLTLTGFEVMEVQATQFPTDSDIDNEDRAVGFIQATITIYKK